MKSIPAWAARPVAAAFLIEFPFYLLPAFDAGRLRNPWLLALSGLIPWLVFSIPTGQFSPGRLAALALVLVVVCFWYAVLPKSGLTDLLFLVLLAAIELTKIFDRIYVFAPLPKLQLSALGHVMLIRIAAIAIIAIRAKGDIDYRFLPSSREWRDGLRWFLYLLPAAGAALWALKMWNLRPNPNLLLTFPEFLGLLWVVALSEEFFFRGLLQQWLERWTNSSVGALIIASVFFGASHLFVHKFPNWRYSIVAGILGLFCGMAWRQTRSIQASMVTHALAATVYRVFFL
ncbi:MAG: CPBP family intramembrane metalloprotease [Acidobacteriota bacterium]|nr:CPBP family intramembrane metalloprotease [Acidobacteriota bacterium]